MCSYLSDSLPIVGLSKYHRGKLKVNITVVIGIDKILLQKYVRINIFQISSLQYSISLSFSNNSYALTRFLLQFTYFCINTHFIILSSSTRCYGHYPLYIGTPKYSPPYYTHTLKIIRLHLY